MLASGGYGLPILETILKCTGETPTPIIPHKMVSAENKKPWASLCASTVRYIALFLTQREHWRWVLAKVKSTVLLHTSIFNLKI